MKSLWGQKPPQQLLLYGALALVLYLGRADLIAAWSLFYIVVVFRNWKKSKKGSACELWVTHLSEAHLILTGSTFYLSTDLIVSEMRKNNQDGTGYSKWRFSELAQSTFTYKRRQDQSD